MALLSWVPLRSSELSEPLQGRIAANGLPTRMQEPSRSRVVPDPGSLVPSVRSHSMEKVVRANVRAVFGLGLVLAAAVAVLCAASLNPAIAQQPTSGVISKFKVILPQDEAELRIDTKLVKTT